MIWSKNKNDALINELRHRIISLEDRVYKLDNPFKFNVGETVYLNESYRMNKRGKILKREWRDSPNGSYKLYSVLVDGELNAEVEHNLMKKPIKLNCK